VLVTEDVGAVRWLRLNRPDKLNALDRNILDALQSELIQLETRPDISIVVLSGNGRYFSAGADILSSPPGTDPSMSWRDRRHDAGAWQRVLDLLERIPQATVASIHGHCYGGAALIAVSCDIRIGDKSLRIRIPEVAMGIPLTWAGIPRLVREIGLPATRDLVMTARVISAREAHSLGFVQRFADDDLSSATSTLVGTLADMEPATLAMTRTMFAAITREVTSSAGWADPDRLRVVNPRTGRHQCRREIRQRRAVTSPRDLFPRAWR
jgi:enoyl-CoA hydratase/carnithine racemase